MSERSNSEDLRAERIRFVRDDLPGLLAKALQPFFIPKHSMLSQDRYVILREELPEVAAAIRELL